MKRIFGTGGATAAAGLALLALGGSGASAQGIQAPVVQAVMTAPVTQAQLPAATSAVDQALDEALGAAGQVANHVATGAGNLAQLVQANLDGTALNAELKCLATAVYFESMGEPLEGQLAVAEVVQNRAASGRYPSSLCGVVKQKAQFSFVKAGGVFPSIDTGSSAWKKAQAIARIASAKLASNLTSDVLWYHADYVAPTWKNHLSKVEKIGAHIFYRA